MLHEGIRNSNTQQILLLTDKVFLQTLMKSSDATKLCESELRACREAILPS